MIAAIALLVAVSAPDTAQLTAMLHQYDREIAALRATERMPGVDDAAAQTERAIAAIGAESGDARARVTALSARDAAFRSRETSTIGTALAPRGATAELNAYRSELARETQATISAFSDAMALRQRRAYAARAQELRERESTLAFDLERADGAHRMVLQLKLNDLRLDTPARAGLRSQIDAIDRTDRTRVAAQRSADAGVLAAYAQRLGAQRAAEERAMNAQLRAHAAASLAVRARVARAQTAAAAALGRTKAAGRGYDFKADATAIAGAFGSTSATLAGRFAQLADTDRRSLAATQAEIASLQAARARVASALLAAQLRR